MKKQATVAIVANTAWNLRNFRRGLVRAFLADGCRVILVAPAGPERSGLEEMGAVFVPLQNLDRKGRNPLRDLALIRELYRIYLEYEVATVLHFTIKPVIYGSFAARMAGVKNISTLTGLGYTFLAGGITTLVTRQLYRLALGSAAQVFFHNPDDRQLFLDGGLVTQQQSSVVGGSGLRLEDYPLVPCREAIPGRFLFAGRLLGDKGIREFVEAASLARAKHPDLTFHVVGPLDPGNPAGIVASELARWVQEGTIVYDGVAEEVRPHLRRASVVVLPSYREGCPRALLEAAATGRPVITTDVPGCREVVLPGKSGWLVPAKDGGALAAACLGAAAAAPEELDAMGRRGRELVEERFGEEGVVASYLKKAKRGGKQ